MATLLTDLQSQDLTNKPHIDGADAHLIMVINEGIVQIDLFIAQAQVYAKRLSKTSRLPTSPNAEGFSAGSVPPGP
jgi:hypothetical protein